MPLRIKMNALGEAASGQKNKIVAVLPILDMRYIDYHTYVAMKNQLWELLGSDNKIGVIKGFQCSSTPRPKQSEG